MSSTNKGRRIFCSLTGVLRSKCDHCVEGVANESDMIVFCSNTGNSVKTCPGSCCQLPTSSPNAPLAVKPKQHQKTAHQSNVESLVDPHLDERDLHYGNPKLSATEKASRISSAKAGIEKTRKVKHKHPLSAADLEFAVEKAITFTIKPGTGVYNGTVFKKAIPDPDSSGVDVRVLYSDKKTDIIMKALAQLGVSSPMISDLDKYDLAGANGYINGTLLVREYSFVETKNTTSGKSRILIVFRKNGDPFYAESESTTVSPVKRKAPNRKIVPLAPRQDGADELITSEADFQGLYRKSHNAIIIDDDSDFPSLPLPITLSSAKPSLKSSVLPPLSLSTDLHQSKKDLLVDQLVESSADFSSVEHEVQGYEVQANMDGQVQNKQPSHKKAKTSASEKADVVDVSLLLNIAAKAKQPPIVFWEGAGPTATSTVCYDESVFPSVDLNKCHRAGSMKDVWVGLKLSHSLFEGNDWLPRDVASCGQKLDRNACIISDQFNRELVSQAVLHWNATHDASKALISPRLIVMELHECQSPILSAMETLSMRWILEKEVKHPIRKVNNNLGEIEESDGDMVAEFGTMGENIIELGQAFTHHSYNLFQEKGCLLDVQVSVKDAAPFEIIDCQMIAWGETHNDYTRIFGPGNIGETAFRTFVMYHNCNVNCPGGGTKPIKLKSGKMTQATALRAPGVITRQNPLAPAAEMSFVHLPAQSLALTSALSASTSNPSTTPLAASTLYPGPGIGVNERGVENNISQEEQWYGLDCIQFEAGFVEREGYFEPVLLKEYNKVSKKFIVDSAYGRPPFSPLTRNDIILKRDNQFLSCTVNPVFAKYVDDIGDKTTAVLSEEVLTQLEAVIPTLQNILDGKLYSELLDASKSNQTHKIRALMVQSSHKGMKLSRDVELILNAAEEDLLSDVLQQRLAFPDGLKFEELRSADEIQCLARIKLIEEVILPEAVMYLNEYRQGLANSAAVVSGKPLDFPSDGTWEGRDWVRTLFNERYFMICSKAREVKSNASQKDENDNNDNFKNDNVDDDDDDEFKELDGVKNKSAVKTPSLPSKKLRGRKSLDVIVPGPAWKVDQYNGKEYVVLLGEAKPDVEPVIPEGWCLKWKKTINNWVAKPTPPSGWSSKWSESAKQWYFINSSSGETCWVRPSKAVSEDGNSCIGDDNALKKAKKGKSSNGNEVQSSRKSPRRK
ncbi:hypothetical protein HDU99_008805 [Rhizoclosmatium hyalinum]|nr:hypothetical protein HDU99_008805 [Rhizoclosmatium hyalinum]